MFHVKEVSCFFMITYEDKYIESHAGICAEDIMDCLKCA